jgi:hypothetical protein
MGVKHCGKPGAGSEPFGMVPKVLDGFARGGKHGVVDFSLMPPGQRAQLSRQGEGHKEVADGKQLLLLPFQPSGGIVVLAFRTTSVTARAGPPIELIALRTA